MMSTTYYIADRYNKKRFENPLVTVNNSGIVWKKCVVEEQPVNGLEDLIKFFSKKDRQERYALEDESGKTYTLNDLMDLLK
ncbi:MAG: hypothetical protein Q4C73_11870 [Eubacteriales bacterium]|nr:hypothetical protein [Eubacteriales bacterium]